MRLHTLLLYIVVTLPIFGITPKREMRGVWISTLTNIDFPKQQYSTTEEQKAEIRQILDQHQTDGINTIFFQVRPTADAFYRSDYEPWSRYLTGEQGTAPEPFYDPLSYIIEEAHKRNMEVHAWINPFRVRLNTNDKLIPGHPYNKHKDWGWDYINQTYFDPGIPVAREYCQKIIMDIVSRYDVDGIHFDDYFYPYNYLQKLPLPDSVSFRKYGGEYYPNRIEDWRRENINMFIKSVSNSIKAVKPWVKFGISPIGVYKNKKNPNEDYPTRYSTSNYENLYADVEKWIKEGWIDYCIPQIYWAIGYAPADFSKLLNWWGQHSHGYNIYAGHCLYKIDKNAKEKAWQSPQEIEKQIELVRDDNNIKGSAFYSSKHFVTRDDLKPLSNDLRNKYYKYPALQPSMPWIDDKAPPSPKNLRIKESPSGNYIIWDAPKYRNEMDKAHWYVIYKTKDQKNKDALIPENIIAITQRTFIKIPFSNYNEEFLITALDRLQNESKPQRIRLNTTNPTSVVFMKEDNPAFMLKE